VQIIALINQKGRGGKNTGIMNIKVGRNELL